MDIEKTEILLSKLIDSPKRTIFIVLIILLLTIIIMFLSGFLGEIGRKKASIFISSDDFLKDNKELADKALDANEQKNKMEEENLTVVQVHEIVSKQVEKHDIQLENKLSAKKAKPIGNGNIEERIKRLLPKYFHIKYENIESNIKIDELESKNNFAGVGGVGEVELLIKLEEEFNCSVSDDIYMEAVYLSDLNKIFESCEITDN